MKRNRPNTVDVGVHPHDEENSDSDSSGDPDSKNEANTEKGQECSTNGSNKLQKKTKKLKKSYQGFSLPTGLKLTPKIINELTETEKLFQSNLYKFQIEELLREIAVPAKIQAKMGKWFADFKKFVETLDPSESYTIDDTASWLENAKLPLCDNILAKIGSKGVFRWVKPTSVHQIGSWTLQTRVYKMSEFDILLQLPKECINNSDYLNHKYHVKRAMYLTYLAIQLRKRGDEVKFICPDGNPLKPALRILLNKVKVIIHCAPGEDQANLWRSKLSPERNNLRFEYFFQTPKPADDPEYSTPNYNSAILSELNMLSYNKIIEQTLSRNENICQALKLLKVWLQQRSISLGFGSFSNFILTMFVCYLMDRKKINNNMSSYQIIRVVFVSLLQTDWTTKGITFSEDSNIKDWHLEYDVIFLDSSNQFNFTANMSKFTYNRVKTEAKLGLDVLNTSDVNGFQSMFLTKVPFLLNFDQVLQVKFDESFVCRLQEDDQYKPSFLNHSGYFRPIGMSVIGTLIEKCLKQRIQILDIEVTRPDEWDLKLAPVPQGQVLRFGLVIEPGFAYKLIEKCESENDSIMKEFKELWKGKSQLRRFRDGSMVETVTFENASQDEKSHVCFLMLEYILKAHLGLSLKRNDIDYLDNQLERISESHFEIGKPKPNDENEPQTIRKKNSRKQEYSPISLDEITMFASTSFEHLSQALRQLDSEGLPLAVTSVQGTSSILRFTNFYPTPPQSFYSSNLLTEEKDSSLIIKDNLESLQKLPKYVEPIGVIVQLEGSGKWPDDLNAIERLKCAFLIRVGQLLKEQFGLCVQVHPRYLNVLKDGFIFQIRLTYYRELILLKQMRGEDGIMKIRDNPKSVDLHMNTLLLPQLTSTLHAFNQRFSAFGKTCRLAKRWVSSHLLLANASSTHLPVEKDYRFTEEAIELIVAYLFLQYAPHLSHPNDGQVGFLRFLNFLATTNWRATSLILNFNEKLSKDDIDNIESEFVNKRDTLPLLFISTPEDKLGSVWTKNLLPIILYRAAVLAGEALVVLKNELIRSDSDDVRKGSISSLKRIFIPDVGHFDVLIWLKQDMSTRKVQSMDSMYKLQFKEYNKRPNELIPIVDFDPIQHFLDELRATFGHLALFLHDHFGGQFIAVVWLPNVLSNMEFKVSNIKARESTNLPKTVTVNEEGVAKLFEVIGKGIVERIELCSNLSKSNKT